jgi:hypothetical protein
MHRGREADMGRIREHGGRERGRGTTGAGNSRRGARRRRPDYRSMGAWRCGDVSLQEVRARVDLDDGGSVQAREKGRRRPGQRGSLPGNPPVELEGGGGGGVQYSKVEVMPSRPVWMGQMRSSPPGGGRQQRPRCRVLPASFWDR